MAKQGDFTKKARERANTNTRAHLEEKPKKKVARFNLNLKEDEYLTYLQQMASLTDMSITDYLNKLIAEDMAAHEGWEKTIDELNKQRAKILESLE